MTTLTNLRPNTGRTSANLARFAPPGSERSETTPFEQAASLALERLQRAFRSLLEAVPGGIRKAADLQRAFDLDSKLAGQVFKVANASDPIATGLNVPPRISLERLLKSATRRHIPGALVSRVAEAFEQFERMVQEQAGDRDEFDSLIAAFIGDEREKLLLASREMMYHASRNIRGMASETAFSTALFLPAHDDPERLEIVRLSADLGLRRIHRGAKILVRNSSSYATDQVLTIDGQPIVDHSSVMLADFCSTPLPDYRVARIEANSPDVWYRLEGDDVGIRSAVDAVRADYLRPALKTRYWSPERPLLRVIKESSIPARWQVVDILTTEDVASMQSSEAFIHEMLPLGDLMQFPVTERVEEAVAYKPVVRYMGNGPGAFRCSRFPRYEEMLEFVCIKRGWDLSRLHGFRVEIEYPVYSWQTCLAVTKLPKP